MKILRLLKIILKYYDIGVIIFCIILIMLSNIYSIYLYR